MPRNDDYDHALSIDKHNVNNEWAKAIKLESDQQHDYDFYKDTDKSSSPKIHTHVRSYFVFDA